jgi:hypothetical protein
MNEVSICRAPSRRAFYRQFGRPRTPVIVRDAVSAWPAARKWSFDWFRRDHGDRRVPLHPNAYEINRDTGAAERLGPQREIALADYVDQVLSGTQVGYVAGSEIYSSIPALRGDLNFGVYASLQRWAVPSFFMGGAGTVSRTHVDWAENLHALFLGRKRWRMWAPKWTFEMQPVHADWRFSVSRRDLHDARGMTITPDLDFMLEPGELLYVPYGWWHHVETVEPSIAANLWYWNKDLLLRGGVRALATTLSIRLGLEAARLNTPREKAEAGR